MNIPEEIHDELQISTKSLTNFNAC